MAAMQLTRTHRILIGVVIAGAVVIAGIGFAGSYAAVRELAMKKGFGNFSLVFPIGIDAGICVLLALDLLLTWIRIPFPLLRQTAWLLTIATIAFNGAAAWPDPLGVGMHAVIPVLFVVTVEAARHAVGRIADITADRHMEGVRITRWILSPVPTFKLWRRMKLWELRSYEQAVGMEQDRLIYQARLQARYGRAWRRKAPVEALMPLRLARIGVPLSQTAPEGLAAAGIDPVLLPPAPTRPGLPSGGGAEAGTAAAVSVAVAEGQEPERQGGQAGQAGRAGGNGQDVPAGAAQAGADQGPQGPGTAAAGAQAGAQAGPAAGSHPGAQGVQGVQAQGVPTGPQGPYPAGQDPQAVDPQALAAYAAQAAQLAQAAQAAHLAQQAQYNQSAPFAVDPTAMPAAHDSAWFAGPKAPQAGYQGGYNPQYVEGLEPTPVMPPAGPAEEPEGTTAAPQPVPAAGSERGEQQQLPIPAPRAEDEPASISEQEFGEAAYKVLRTFLAEHGNFPTPEALEIHLADGYGVTHPRSSSLLRRIMPELRHRYEREAEAEHIA
ncbi:DUF2637 domain-containing protein [Streptomyces sp. NPDC048603]|uniref:DUF2637 domain-containing protein n=1 Tax=Streptomyces sp. NPDC048603 TaxID=3365577 RepID=UPI00371E0682